MEKKQGGGMDGVWAIYPIVRPQGTDSYQIGERNNRTPKSGLELKTVSR